MISFLLKFGESRIAIIGAPLLPRCLAKEWKVSIEGMADRARLSFVIKGSGISIGK